MKVGFRKTCARLVMCCIMSWMIITSVSTGVCESISPRYTYTNCIVASLSIDSSGVARCGGEIVVYELDNELNLSVRLQRKEGNVWVLVKKWTASADGGRDLYIDKTYTVTEGTYRVIATGLVTAPDGDIETCSCTTSQRTYP